jgi:hypothetical protein
VRQKDLPMGATKRMQIWRVIVFSAMTFLLSWGFNLAPAAVSGDTSYPELGQRCLTGYAVYVTIAVPGG